MRATRGIDATSPSLLLSSLLPLLSEGVGEHVLRRLDDQLVTYVLMNRSSRAS